MGGLLRSNLGTCRRAPIAYSIRPTIKSSWSVYHCLVDLLINCTPAFKAHAYQVCSGPRWSEPSLPQEHMWVWGVQASRNHAIQAKHIL